MKLFHYIIFIALVIMMMSVTAWGQLLVAEDFNFTGNLSANGWTAHSGAGSNSIASSATSLTYSGYIASGNSNSASFTTSGEDVNKAFTSTTSGTLYASALVRITSSQTTGDYFFHFSFSTNIFYARTFVKKDPSTTNFAFGIMTTSGGAATPTYTDFSYALNTTYLIVIKYDFSSNEVSLWIDPELNVPEPSPTITHFDAGQLVATNLAGIAVRQGSGSNAAAGRIGGIRVATSWDFLPLPVELTSFTAIAKGRGVELAWKTATEINNLGFEVERAVVSGQSSATSWSKIGFVEGHGTTNAPQSYTFVDASAKGTVSYRLKQIDRDGQFEYHKAIEVSVAKPSVFTLDQNYPNPFNPSTAITYSVPNTGKVSLQVFDVLGKEVASLVNGVVEAGEHTAQFNASQLPSGIYFYTIHANNFTATKKMTLVK